MNICKRQTFIGKKYQTQHSCLICILAKFKYANLLISNILLYFCNRNKKQSSNRATMVDEKVILQVLAEQQEYVQSYEPQKWVGRYEENLFELDSPLSIKKYLRILAHVS